MKVNEAIQLYCDKYSDPDKQKTFVGVIKHLGWDTTDPNPDIADYLIYIRDNSDTWLNEALPSYRSYNSKRKLQSALNAFFTLNAVSQTLAPELIASVQTNVAEALKKTKLQDQDDASSTSSSITISPPHQASPPPPTYDEVCHDTDTDSDDDTTTTLQELIKKLSLENMRLKKKLVSIKDIAISLAAEHNMGATTLKIIDALFDP